MSQSSQLSELEAFEIDKIIRSPSREGLAKFAYVIPKLLEEIRQLKEEVRRCEVDIESLKKEVRRFLK